MLTACASSAQEESKSLDENNKWIMKKKFKQGGD